MINVYLIFFTVFPNYAAQSNRTSNNIENVSNVSLEAYTGRGLWGLSPPCREVIIRGRPTPLECQKRLSFHGKVIFCAPVSVCYILTVRIRQQMFDNVTNYKKIAIFLIWRKSEFDSKFVGNGWVP